MTATGGRSAATVPLPAGEERTFRVLDTTGTPLPTGGGSAVPVVSQLELGGAPGTGRLVWVSEAGREYRI